MINDKIKNYRVYNKDFINNFLNEDFDRKSNYSNIKWDNVSNKNFDSNNEILSILKGDKNHKILGTNKGKPKKNAGSNFNYKEEYLEELKNNRSKYSNLYQNEEKESLFFNDSSNFIPTRNTSDLQKILLFSDDNFNNNLNNYENYEYTKGNINSINDNTLKNHSFEKMVKNKFGSNKALENNSNSRSNNKNRLNRKNTVKKLNIKEKLENKNRESNQKFEKINKFKVSERSENPIDHYFQKRHMREIQKLDHLRQEKINKEISEIQDRPQISEISKKIFDEKIQENKHSKNVFDRLLSPSQV